MVSQAQRRVLAERGTPALLGHHLDPTYELYPHVRLLSAKSVDLVSGISPRQCWAVPPQHGKSYLAARLLPLWILDWDPTKRIVVASYGADLAHGHGRWIRNAIRENEERLRVRLSPDSRAAYRWNTPQGGGLLATGIGGSLTGFSATTVVIDDPFADWEAAQSKTERDRVINWFQTVARTRLQKGGSIICLQTRWHPDDLIGTLLQQDAEGTGEGWDYTRLPAIADHDPTNGEIDLLGREPGEVLCEELHGFDEIHAAMRSAGPFIASSLYQQHPTPPDGNMFPASAWLELDDDEPFPRRKDFIALVRAWDLASTEGGGDYTVGVLLGRHRDGRTFVLDVVRDRRNPSGVRSLIQSTALWDKGHFGTRVAIRIEQQPGSAGVEQREMYLEETLAAFTQVKFVPSTGAKTIRAVPFASDVVDNLVVLAPVRGDWSVTDFVAEYAGFPVGGSHDDQVDAGSLAFNSLRELARYSRPVRLTSVADDESLVDGIALGL